MGTAVGELERNRLENQVLVQKLQEEAATGRTGAVARPQLQTCGRKNRA